MSNRKPMAATAQMVHLTAGEMGEGLDTSGQTSTGAYTRSRMSVATAVRLALVLAILPMAGALLAGPRLEAGSTLVATAKSHDPDFARSVVVLIRYDAESAIGLMLNKPTDVPITDVLPEAKARPAVVYAGGPVTIGVRGLLRTKAAPFFSVITSKPELVQRISGGSPGDFRIYAGYSGWTAGQLQNEVARRLWTVLAADEDIAFDPHPETLWQRLSRHKL